MKRINLKKTAVIALAGLMMTQAALTGCGKKTVDYNVDGTNEQDGEEDGGSKSDRGGIAGRLGVPVSCNETIDPGNSGLGNITINCEEIQVPEVEKMVVTHFTPLTLTNEDKKKYAEILFEKDKGIYVVDYEHQTKDDIQQQIDWYKEEIDRAKGDGDTDYLSFLEPELEKLEESLVDAPDTYPEAGDYSGESFRGTIEGKEYNMNIYGESTDDYPSITTSIYLGPKDYLSFRPYEGATYCYTDTYSYEEADNATNASSMTIESAEELAGKYLDSLGITDIVKVEANDLKWVYFGSNDEELANEADGYYFKYVRANAGAPVYSGRTWNVDNLNQINGWINTPVESFSISIYDGEVVDISIEQVYNTADSVEDAELLPYDKIIECANAEIGKYYEKYPPRYKNIEFNDMRLTYYIVADGEGKAKYIPVWVLSQYEELMNSDSTDEPTQLVVINAIDGSVIDLVENAKSLGCFEEY